MKKRPRLFFLGTCIVVLFSLAANANEDIMANEQWVQGGDDPPACSEPCSGQCANMTVTVIYQDGLCSAYWICDGQSYSVICNQTTCDCFKEGVKIRSCAFSACDSCLLIKCCCDT